MKPAASVLLNNSSSVIALQTATAIIEAGAGVALLSLPSLTVQLLLGAPLATPAALTAARVGGTGLLALGAASWLARGDTQSRAAKALYAAMAVWWMVSLRNPSTVEAAQSPSEAISR